MNRMVSKTDLKNADISLAEINAAIRKILVSGQSVTIGGRYGCEVTRADLNTLYAMKKEMESASVGGGMFGRVGTAVFDRR